MPTRRGISTEGARETGRQAAGAVDVEARVARLLQDALAAPVLAGSRTIPVVTTLVAVVVAPSGARRRSGPEGQVPVPAAVRRRLADQGLVLSREVPAKKRKEFPIISRLSALCSSHAFSGAPDHFRRARMVLLSSPHNEEGRLQNPELLPLRHPRLQSVGEENAFVQSRTHVALLRLREVL